MNAAVSPGHIGSVIANWGYIGIFLCVFVGNLGVPVPEETVVLTAGFLAGRNILDIRLVFVVVVLSAIAGDSTGYLIGRTGGQRLLDRLCAISRFMRHRRERFEGFFHAHGSKAVFMARFVTGLRFMAGPMAGAAGMRFVRFIKWNVLGAVVWCSLMVAIGYLVGDELDQIMPASESAGHWVALAAVLLVLCVFIFWWRERHNATTDSGS